MGNRLAIRFPLVVVLNVPFALLLLVSAGLIGYLGFQNGTQAVNDLANQLQATSDAWVNQYLDSYLATPQLINDLNLDAIRQNQLNLADPLALERHFLAQMRRFPMVASIAFATEQREYLGIARQPAGADFKLSELSIDTGYTVVSHEINLQAEQGNLFPPIPNYDPRVRLWYHSAVVAGQPTWTPIFAWSDGVGVGLDKVTPVHAENGDLLGVLDVSLVLDGIHSFLQNAPVTPHGNVFIVDDAGLLVGSSTNSDTFSHSNNSIDLLNALNVTDQVTHAAAQSVVERFGDWTTIQSSQPLHFDLLGERYLMSVTPYQNTGLRWWVVVVIPENDFLSSINGHFRQTQSLIVLALILSVAVTSQLSRWITKPILQLNSATKAFAAGNWSQRLEINRQNELGELAVSFNYMADQLQNSTFALQSSEVRLRAIFENSAEAIAVTDKNGFVTYNTAFEVMFGYPTPDALVGAPTLDVIAPGERVRIAEYIRQRATGDSAPFAYETHGLRQDGTEFDMEARVSTFVQNGEIYSIALLRNITERKQAEEALRVGERRYRQLIENLHVGVFVRAPDSRVVLYNRRTAEQLALTDEQIRGEAAFPDGWHLTYPDGSPIPPDQGPAFRVLATGKPVENLELGIKRSSESDTRWALVNAFPNYDEQRRLIDVVVTFLDVSERKHAEAALRESEKRFRSTFEQAAVGIAHVSPDGHFLMINQRYCDMLGYRQDEMLTKSFQELTHPDDLAADVEFVRRILAREIDTFSMEKRYLRKDETIQWVQLTTSMTWGNGGLPQYFITVIQDIADRKRIEDALQKSYDELEERVIQRTAQLQSKDHVEAILNSSVDGILLAGRDFTIQQTNAAVDRMFACEANGYLNKSLRDFILAEPDDLTRNTILTHTASDHNLYREVHVRRQDGTTFDAEMSVGYIDAEGLVCVIRDITERKQAQVILEKRNLTLTSLHTGVLEIEAELDLPTLLTRIMRRAVDLLQAQLGGGVFLFNREDNVIRFAAASGFHEDMIGVTFPPDGGVASCIFETGQPLIIDDFNRWERGGEYRVAPPLTVLGVPFLTQGQAAGALLVYANTQERTFTPDDVRLAEMFAAQAATALQNAQLYTSAQQEIASRKETEMALRQSEERLEKRNLTLTSLHSGILEISSELDVPTLLPRIMHRAVDLLNADRGGGIYLYDPEKNLLTLEAVAGLNQGRQGLTLASNQGVSGQVIQTGEPLIVNNYAQWDRRATVLVDNPSSAVMGVPLLIRDQAVGVLLVIANSEVRTFNSDDVHMAEMFAAQAAATLHNAQLYTAAQQALATEKELNDLKSRFVSMASHEFRTPLATILALVETLSAYRHKLEEDEIENLLDKMKDQVGHLKDIMEDVLLLARMQARRVQFNPAQVDLDELYRTVLAEFQSRPDVKHQLNYSGTSGTCEMLLDRKLIRQVISNLVSNAIKYSAEDKVIRVDLECTQSTVILKVRDEGIGIPEADLPHLFEPFHRAENVGAISGTGLGLVITREAVELHGGTIAVESQLGVGTAFTIQLPVNPEGRMSDDPNSDD